MASRKHVPEDEALHNGNGHGTALASSGSPGTDEKKSGEAQAADRIRLNGAAMDFKAWPIRRLLEYFLDSGDQAAWAELATRLRRSIRTAAFKRLHRSNRDAPLELLEDLEQDTHVKLLDKNCKALRNLKWPHAEAIYPYVTVVATNVARDWIRKHKTIPDPLDENKQVLLARHKAIDAGPLRKRIDEALFTQAGKPHFTRDRGIFWLYYRWEYTAAEIARLPSVNLPVKKVENILQRLMRVVRSRLGADPKKVPVPE